MWSISTQAATSGIAIAITLTSVTAQGDIINVPGDQPTIQAGIDAAVNGDEVVLANGTYTGAGNVNCTFGGKLITVRSASGDPEACIIDCEDAPNTRGFTFDDAETSAAVLSGITITNGTGLSNQAGAILISASSPTISNCHFTFNDSNLGGAINSISGSNPVITGCLFQGNEANQGGAMRSLDGSPAFSNCDFVGNTADASGGGVLCNGGSSTFHSSRFIGNSVGSGSGGGAFISAGVSAQFVNCLFDKNVAGSSGGAVRASNTPTVQFFNCTLAKNDAMNDGDAEGGGAVFVGGGAVTTVTLRNCIVWNSSPQHFDFPNGVPVTFDVAFSNIEDGWPGIGNLDVWPLFTNPQGPDFVAGTTDDDFSLRSPSAGIDGGSNADVPRGVTTDIDGNPRFVDDPETPDIGEGRPPLVDMGCYEFQPDPASTCPWDFSGDGDVGGADLGELLLNWGECGLP